MNISFEHIDQTLKAKVPNLILIEGDDYTHRRICSEKILNVWKQQTTSVIKSFSSRDKKHITALNHLILSKDLLSANTIFVLDIINPSLDKTTLIQMSHIIDKLSKNDRLLITTVKCTPKQSAAKWYKSVQNSGLRVVVSVLYGAQMINWFQNYCRNHYQLTLDSTACEILISATEGNTASLLHEAEKLYLAYGISGISPSHHQITQLIGGEARYNFYHFINDSLEGKRERSLHLLNALLNAGSPTLLILYTITQEIRKLISVCEMIKHEGCSIAQACDQQRIWSSHKQRVAAALHRLSHTKLHVLLAYAHKIEGMIKGIQQGNTTLHLTKLVYLLSSGHK